MNPQFQLFPEQASATAVHLDHLTLYLLGVAAFFSTLIFALIFIFAIKYAAGPGTSAWEKPAMRFHSRSPGR